MKKKVKRVPKAGDYVTGETILGNVIQERLHRYDAGTGTGWFITPSGNCAALKNVHVLEAR